MRRAFIIAIFLALLPPAALAAEGSTGTRGGGDSYAIEFIQIGKEMLLQFRRSYPEQLAPIDLVKLEATLSKVAVESTDDPLSFEGALKDAIFEISPSPKIHLSRKRWDSIGDSGKRVALVLHELLGIMEVEHNNDYHISSALSEVKDLARDIQANAEEVLIRESARQGQCYKDTLLAILKTRSSDFSAKRWSELEPRLNEKADEILFRNLVSGIRRIRGVNDYGVARIDYVPPSRLARSLERSFAFHGGDSDFGQYPNTDLYVNSWLRKIHPDSCAGIR